MQMKQKVGTSKRKLCRVQQFIPRMCSRNFQACFLVLSLFIGMNRPSHYFPKSNFHLPDRNNSTDNQDAMKNTNEIKRAPKTRKKSTEDKNYKTMDLERDKKEALTGNLALKYRIRCTILLSFGSQGLAFIYLYLYLQKTLPNSWKEERMENSWICFYCSPPL